MKTEFDKLDNGKLVNVANVLSSFKTEVNYLDIYKMKNVPIDIKKSSDLVDKNVVKMWKYKKLNMCKNVSASPFSIDKTINLSCNEQVCLMRLHFERYFSNP